MEAGPNVTSFAMACLTDSGHQRENCHEIAELGGREGGREEEGETEERGRGTPGKLNKKGQAQCTKYNYTQEGKTKTCMNQDEPSSRVGNGWYLFH